MISKINPIGNDMTYFRDTWVHLVSISFFLLLLLSLAGCIDNGGKNVLILEQNIGFDTISEALSYAEAGDTLLVKCGVYTEHIVVQKAIVIRGEDRNTTIVKGNESGDVFFITANNVELSGFTITDSGDASEGDNAGVDIRSEFNLIKNIEFVHNANFGCYLYQAHNNTIDNCVFEENGQGGLVASNCNHNVYTNNTVVNNSLGFELRYVYDSMIANNSFSKQDETSIDKGIYLYASRYNLITDNIFTENSYGIHVKGSKMNTIHKNLFLNNDLGLYFCCGGLNNTIYQNVFMNNNDHASGYLENSFDNGSIGNYWDDYNGTDADGDGIGDTPYTVTDEFGIVNIDHFPLMKPLS